MTENELQEGLEIKDVIERSVDESVERAFRKYGKVHRFTLSLRGLIALLVVLALACTGIYFLGRKRAGDPVAPVEDHDQTLENHGIFGFTAADFEEPVLGAAKYRQLLIVEEREAYVNTKITETGLFNWGVFNKQQVLTIYGMGQYTIDLAQVTAAHVSLNEDTYELTICIPHAELHQTSFNPSKTEVGDAQNGWLAFGAIKLTAEQQKEFEVTATGELEKKLSEESRFAEADRFAKLAAYETYQPIVSAVSPAYKVIIAFQ